VAPRHLFDLGLGVDNLLHTDRTKLRVRFSVINLTNEDALYNFLSTFSGTQFVTPRAYQLQLGVTFQVALSSSSIDDMRLEPPTLPRPSR
jgi:hypothetical protein